MNETFNERYMDTTLDTDLDIDLDITLDTDLDTDLDTTLDTDLHSISFSLSHYEGMVIHNFNVPPVAAISAATQDIILINNVRAHCTMDICMFSAS